MKLKQRKELAARIRSSATDADIPPANFHGRFCPHESDAVIVEGGLKLRLRNSPLTLDRVANTVERGEPWKVRCGCLKPSIPDLDAVVALYGSPEKAFAKIMEHLLIQKEYMEKGQVDACRKMCKELIDKILK